MAGDGELPRVRNLLSVLSCVLCLACSTPHTYEMGTQTVQLDPPSGWSDYHTRDSGTGRTLLSWDTGRDSATDLDGAISVTHQPGGLPLDLEALKYPDATEQKEGKLSMAGGADNATYLECVTAGGGGPLGKGKIHHLTVFCEQGDQLYTFSLTSREETYQSHRATFERLLKSFKVP